MNKMNTVTKRTLLPSIKNVMLAALGFIVVILIIGLLFILFGSDLSFFSVDLTASGFTIGDGSIFVSYWQAFILILNLFLSIISFSLLIYPIIYTRYGFESLRLGISRKSFFTYTSIVLLILPLIQNLIYAFTAVNYNGNYSDFFQFFTAQAYVDDLLTTIIFAVFGMLTYKYGYKIFLLIFLIPILQIVAALLVFVVSVDAIAITTALANFYAEYTTLVTFVFVALGFGVYYFLVKRTNIKTA